MKPNVLFIVIDSLRSDKCFNENKTSVTPYIDSLIKNGAYFTQAISSSDGTYTSLGSLFTGQYPFNNNIDWFHNHTKAAALFDYLEKHDYYTYGTVPNHQFFHTLTAKFSAKIITEGDPYLRLFEGTGQQILDSLDNLKEPWIYYLHIMDLHVHNPVPNNFANRKYGNDEYEQRISSIDPWIGEIIKKIDLQKTLVILTSDHGEYVHDLHLHAEHIPSLQKKFRKMKQSSPRFLIPLGIQMFVMMRWVIKQIRLLKLKRVLNETEKRTLIQRGTDYLYDEAVRIPLLFCGYGIEKPKIVNDQVRQIDVVPTILDLIGLPSMENNVDGRSISSLINGEKLEELPACIETVPSLKKKLGNIIGIRTSKYKYYRSRFNPHKDLILFDLENDPLEKINIVNLKLDTTEKMEELLNKYRKRTQNKKSDVIDEDSNKIREELKKLGYV